MTLEVDRTDTAAALELTVTKDPDGGVTGLLPTVAIRQLPSTNSYLDWNDNTFKTSGWTTKYAVMTEVERGHYHKTFNVNALGLTSGTKLFAEYNVDNGSTVKGAGSELIVVSDLRADTTFVRKMHTNRLEESAGATGLLRLYDDDGSTVLKTWGLTDETGGSIPTATSVPAKRGQSF